MASIIPARSQRPQAAYIPPSDPEISLAEDVAAFTHDPLGYAYYAFPWGEKGSPLERNEDGSEARLEEWQEDVLTEIGQRLAAGEDPMAVLLPILMSIASGHGVGKSALLAIIILWAMSTFEDCRGVVTANTENQLRTKTWPELTKWYNMCINRHWFRLTATALHSVDPEHERTWRFDMVPWSDTNTEAFAGLHNKGKRIIVVFDEGSAIPDVIWETTEGALTDKGTEIIWCAFGNPTRNVGRFRDCFESLAHRWWHKHVDSRNVSFSNKEQIKSWLDDYGDDSDFARVRILGIFPRAGAMQFFSSEDWTKAESAEARATVYDPLILSVDVARFGSNESVMVIRKGKDARTHTARRWRGLDTMQLAAQIAIANTEFSPDAIFIDAGGVGGGVVDRCRMLKLPVIGVEFGGKPDRVSIDGAYDRYYNKRAEMYGNLRKAIKEGLAIERHADLKKQAIQQTYEHRTIRGGDAIILTSKEAMMNDGLESPDWLDALAMSYAFPVAMDPRKVAGYVHKDDSGSRVKSEYDPFAVGDSLDRDPSTLH